MALRSTLMNNYGVVFSVEYLLSHKTSLLSEIGLLQSCHVVSVVVAFGANFVPVDSGKHLCYYQSF